MQAESDSVNTPATNPLEKLSFSAVISGVTAYSVALGMSYLWGYWSPFGINILDYMGMTDIVTATAWPLFGLCSAMLVGMLMGGGGNARQGSGIDNRVGKALIWYWTNLRELHFLGLFLIWVLEVPYKWSLLGLLGGTPLSIYLLRQSWLDQLPMPGRLKLLVVFFVVAAPAGAISTGQQHSKNLLEGRFFQVVYSDMEGIYVPVDAKQEARLRLIGQRGETIFMWDPQLKRTVIAKFPTNRPVVLGRFEAFPTGTGWESIVLWVKKLGS